MGSQTTRLRSSMTTRGAPSLPWSGRRSTASGASQTRQQTVDGTGPRVFETYKLLEEVFHNDGSAPTAWNQYDSPKYNSCNIQAAFGDLTLGSFSKYSNLGQSSFGSLVGPLVAQNTTYVRFLTAYNETEFNQILAQQWYLRKNLPTTGLTFQVGSLDVKSSWIIMTGIRHPDAITPAWPTSSTP